MPNKKPRQNNSGKSDKSKNEAKKAPEVSGEDEEEETPLQTQLRFEQELRWCIDEIENSIVSCKKKDGVEEAMRVLKVLKSGKCSVVRKRQAMSQHLGDYRKTMQQQAEKSRGEGRKKLYPVPGEELDKSGVFLKKRADKDCREVADGSFAFAFELDRQT